MSKTNTTQNGQFELPTDGLSLQQKQAAALGYIEGYLSSHFKGHDTLTLVNYRYMRQEILRLFGIDILRDTPLVSLSKRD